MNLEKTIRSLGLDTNIQSKIETSTINKLITDTVKDNIKPIKKLSDQAEEEVLLMHKDQVTIAMNSLARNVMNNVVSNPKMLLSVIDDTHARTEKAKIEKFTEDTKMSIPLKEEYKDEI